MENHSPLDSLSESHSSHSSREGMPYVLGNRHRVHRISNSLEEDSSNNVSEHFNEQPIINNINLTQNNLIHVNEIQTNFLPFMERIVHPMRHLNPFRENNENMYDESLSNESELDGNYFQKKFKGIYKIYSFVNKEKFFLSSQRYYPNDQINDNISAICAIKKEYEGQQWVITKKFSGLYIIEYNENEYEMEKWKINVQQGKYNLEVILSQQENSVFKFLKCENENVIIQDGLTDLFFMIDKKRFRDSKSYFISLTNDMEKASKFSFANLISFKENSGVNNKKKIGIINTNKKI